MNHTKAVAYLC